MTEITVKIQNQTNTISRKQFLERIVDWHEDGHHVIDVLKLYDKNYRKKICSKCPEQQQLKRKCLKLDMYTPEGIQLKHCSHMDRARVQKHKPLIRKHMQFLFDIHNF